MAKIRKIRVITSGSTADTGTRLPARDLAQRLRQKNLDRGIVAPIKPQSYPELPADITDPSGRDLSSLYGKFDAYGAYVGYHLAEAEVNVLDVQNAHSNATSKAMLEELELVGDKKVSVSQLKASIRLNDELVALNEASVYHKAEVILLKERLTAIERSIRVLSREQSRRESEREHTK